MKFTPTLGGSYSGSLGGSVASHNKGGPYFRRRAIPTNPNTTRQQIVRAALAGFTAAWSNTLTAAQRTAWSTYASNVPATDRIGQTIQLTGQQWYVGNNTPRQQARNSSLTAGSSVPLATAAPTTFNRGESVVGLTTLSELSGTITLTALLSAAASDDGDALLFVGKPINVGVGFYKGPYQLASVVAVAADATTAAFVVDTSDSLEWASDHIFAATERMPLRIVMVYDDGRVSQSFDSIETIAQGV